MGVRFDIILFSDLRSSFSSPRITILSASSGNGR
jgi:hypothetical protein